jgi:heparan-alpha-glucosaminide N-acetyltransferase
VVMMFANFGGARYWFFDHARWNGLTVADLLFPWFVFMSGVSAALSFASERRRGATAASLAYKSCVRCLKLLFLGLFIVNSPTYLPGMRAFSVLSYFAISYLFIGLVDALIPVLGQAGASAAAPPSFASALYTDFGRYALQWGAMGAVAAVYLLMRFFLHAPGCPVGYAGAAGLADQGAYDASCVGGAAGYFNVLLFGAKHSYSQPTCTDVYRCGPYDPEGAMGALMASWMAWLGLSAGRMLEAQRAEGKARGRGDSAGALAPGITVRWVTMGLVLCLGAGILCGCAWWRVVGGGASRARRPLWAFSGPLLAAHAALAQPSQVPRLYSLTFHRALTHTPLRPSCNKQSKRRAAGSQ